MQNLQRFSGLSNIGEYKKKIVPALQFDGVDDYAYSAVVEKTAYHGTVSGGVAISSDSDGPYIAFTGASSGKFTNASAIPGISLASSFTVTFKFKTGSDVTNIQTIFNNIISSNDRVACTVRLGELRVGIYNGSTYVGPKSGTVLANTLYEGYWTFNSATNTSVLVLNGITSSGVNTPAATGVVSFYVGGYNANFLTGNIYYIRLYNTLLSGTTLTTELAVGQKISTNANVVGTYLPMYYTGTLGTPTTVYDVKAITQGTPIVMQATCESDGGGSETGGIVGLPYCFIYDDNGLTGQHTFVGTIAYVDGTLVSTLWKDGEEQSIDGFDGTNYTDSINIGSTDGSSDFFDGNIYNVKVYVGTITDEESEQMSRGLDITPVNATLLLYIRPVHGETGGTLTDSSYNGYNMTIDGATRVYI